MAQSPDYVAQAAAHRALVNATDIRRAAETRSVAALAAQAAAVRACFEAGVSVPEMVRITNLSRTRIYEMRDGK